MELDCVQEARWDQTYVLENVVNGEWAYTVHLWACVRRSSDTDVPDGRGSRWAPAISFAVCFSIYGLYMCMKECVCANNRYIPAFSISAFTNR